MTDTAPTAVELAARRAWLAAFNADMPPTGQMSHDDLLIYLDKNAGSIDDEENVRATARSRSRNPKPGTPHNAKFRSI